MLQIYDTKGKKVELYLIIVRHLASILYDGTVEMILVVMSQVELISVF